ncbi:hypothetical protein HJC99_06435 [Candidatus Saccharibacteria bacterium]|nr:hypothetical protein [Candidatus Saccharibacteria bacterium]
MKTYRPFLSYLRTSVICILLALIIAVLGKTDLPVTVGIVLLLGLISELPSLLLNPRVTIDQSHTLTYRLTGSTTHLELKNITNCTYRLKFGIRGSAFFIFHLYDSSGNFINLPANSWWGRKSIVAALKQAVEEREIEVDRKTAKKLGLTPTPKI